MKILLSLNNKFFYYKKPKEIIDIINKYNSFSKYDTNLDYKKVQGFEIYTLDNSDEYIKEFVRCATQNYYIVNFHSAYFTNYDQMIVYFNFIKELATIQNRKVNIVFHTEFDKNIDMTYEKSNNAFENISKIINDPINNFDKYFDISIENLNDLYDMQRLKKEDLDEFLNINNSFKFTFDIGHELNDGIKDFVISKKLISRLNNIHIHTSIELNNLKKLGLLKLKKQIYNCNKDFDKSIKFRSLFNNDFIKKERQDHFPILQYENSKYAIDTLNYLITLGYDDYVVMEYAKEYIEGSSYEAKMKNYIEEADILRAISNKHKNISLI